MHDRLHLLIDAVFDERHRLGREHLGQRGVGARQLVEAFTDKSVHLRFKSCLAHQAMKALLGESQNLPEGLFANRLAQLALQQLIDLSIDKLFNRHGRFLAL